MNGRVKVTVHDRLTQLVVGRLGQIVRLSRATVPSRSSALITFHAPVFNGGGFGCFRFPFSASSSSHNHLFFVFYFSCKLVPNQTRFFSVPRITQTHPSPPPPPGPTATPGH